MFLFVCPIFAQEGRDVYSAQLPVENQSEAQRQKAFDDALREVLESLSQTPNLKVDADTAVLFEHPDRYVESYSYLSDPEQPDALQIVVHFDQHALQPFISFDHPIQQQHYDLQISGISSVESLNALTQYLNQVKGVRTLSIQQVTGDVINLTLVLKGVSVDGFVQTLLTSQRFVAADKGSVSNLSVLQFKWIGE